MRQKFKELLNQKVEFFDDKTGSILQANLEYLPNWWDTPFIVMIHVGKKNFTVQNEYGKNFTYRYNRISNIKNQEITFFSL